MLSYSLLSGLCPDATVVLSSRVTLTSSLQPILVHSREHLTGTILTPARRPLQTSSTTSQNSGKNKIQGKVRQPMKMRNHLGQDGGSGKPMQVGIGYTVRGFCDGQSLASPGRWSLSKRNYPQLDSWKAVVMLVKKVLRCFRYCRTFDGVGAGSSQTMPFPERGGE